MKPAMNTSARPPMAAKGSMATMGRKPQAVVSPTTATKGVVSPVTMGREGFYSQSLSSRQIFAGVLTVLVVALIAWLVWHTLSK